MSTLQTPAIHILVVEDEPFIAEDIAGRLAKLGYGVVGIAESAAEAIALATLHQPDLVLMDIILEGDVDGITAADEIGRSLHIPVVYLTANADETTLQRAKLTQPFGYLLKPFKEKELQVTVEISLARHQADLEIRRSLDRAVQLQQLAESSRDRDSQYLLTASHEFRTPLSTIKLIAEFLQRDDLSDEKKEQYLRCIQAATESMNRLLEDVLTLGEMGSPQATEFMPALLDVVGFCANILEALQWSVGKQHTLHFVSEVTSLPIWVDEKLLWHILNNLLSNAIKYSPADTAIVLSLRCDRDQLVLTVADQGIGIPLSDQARLFEPFQRASNVGKVPGTGLGLAIAKRAIERHGGHIQLHSEVGQGTTFVVTLPIKR
ncbi:MAG TPA: ATP-binding protein [Chroococcidiopsis sp.]